MTVSLAGLTPVQQHVCLLIVTLPMALCLFVTDHWRGLSSNQSTSFRRLSFASARGVRLFLLYALFLAPSFNRLARPDGVQIPWIIVDRTIKAADMENSAIFANLRADHNVVKMDAKYQRVR